LSFGLNGFFVLESFLRPSRAIFQKNVSLYFNSNKMGYSNFKKIRQVTKKFGLKAQLTPLFDAVPLRPASDWLTKSLEITYKAPATTEKAKSERLVSPILMEVGQSFQNSVTLFSGEEININSNDDLAGPCDFLFALSPPSLLLEAPIISIAEAKAVCRSDEDLDWGIAQCSAQLYAAHLFNRPGFSYKTLMVFRFRIRS
jgi:hypothetical protein